MAEPDHVVIHPVASAEWSKKQHELLAFFAEVMSCHYHASFPFRFLVISVQSIPEVAKQHVVCDFRKPGGTIAW